MAQTTGVPTVELCAYASLSPERGRVVRHGERELAVFLDGDAVRVIDNACLHTGGPLADGTVVDGCVVCPWHGWVYELATGRCVVGARSAGSLAAYAARVEDGKVVVELE